MYVLNIGLETNDGSTIDARAALVAVAARCRGAVSCGIKQSDSEQTIVIVADDINARAVYRIAEQLRQDCIALYDVATGQGRLIGPNAAAWGEFTPAYFIKPDGSRLDSSYAAELNAAAHDLRLGLDRGMTAGEAYQLARDVALRGEC